MAVMIFRDIVAPAYVPPGINVPAWVWSIAGYGWNGANSTNSVIVRFDYVQIVDGKFELVNNFYNGSVGSYYRPVFTQQNYGSNPAARWIDGGGDANGYWNRWAYKMLYAMKTLQAAYTMIIPKPYHVARGSVASSANLPGSGNTAYDGYRTTDTNHIWLWLNNSWNDAGWYAP